MMSKVITFISIMYLIFFILSFIRNQVELKQKRKEHPEGVYFTTVQIEAVLAVAFCVTWLGFQLY